MSVHGAFRFHGVGQGLFYSGILRKKVGTKTYFFSFVYDCGSLSNRKFLKREIEDFKLLLPKKKLDLLVISHLHDDHVNGLEMLLEGIEVKTVVMPYTHDGLLLLAQLESSDNEAFLQDFYAAPADWLISKGVKRVVFLGTSGENWERSNENKDIDGFPLDESKKLFMECNRIAFDDDGTIVYVNNKAKLNCGLFDWTFQLKNEKFDQRVFRSYLDAVNEYKSEKVLTLEQIMKSNRLRRELKETIRKKVGYDYSINRTSVILYHAPRESIDREHCITKTMNALYPWWHRFSECETILTGDIDSYNEADLLPGVSGNKYAFIIQYPHHGASDKLVLLPDIARINVLSYGLTNRYGHPDYDVIDGVRNTISVTERVSFDYEIVYDS